MNVLITTDIEGIPGITTMESIFKSTDEGVSYGKSCRKLENALNWVIETCIENGADDIYYIDGHGGGGNIIEENINPRAVRINLEEQAKLLKAGKIDCNIELGAHARAGTLGGFLDHTFNSSVIFDYQINGKSCNELSLQATLYGNFNVPTILCVGDVVACEQAKEYIPEIRTAPVKKGTERNVCEELPNAEQVVREATADALVNYKNIPPYKPGYPITIQQTTYRTDMTDRIYAAMRAKGDTAVERLDARTLRKTVTEINNYFDLRFWA